MVALNRITSNPDIMGGKACIRNMRITVALILNLVARGMNKMKVLRNILGWCLKT